MQFKPRHGPKPAFQFTLPDLAPRPRRPPPSAGSVGVAKSATSSASSASSVQGALPGPPGPPPEDAAELALPSLESDTDGLCVWDQQAPATDPLFLGLKSNARVRQKVPYIEDILILVSAHIMRQQSTLRPLRLPASALQALVLCLGS